MMISWILVLLVSQYYTAGVLLVFVYPVLYSRYIVGIRVLSTVQPVYCWCLSTVQPVYCWYSCTVQRGSEPLVLIDAGLRINAAGLEYRPGVRAVCTNRRRGLLFEARAAEPYVPVMPWHY